MKNQEKAKMIKMIEGLELEDRNAFFIAGRMKKPYSTIHQHLSILQSQGLLDCEQIKRRLHFSANPIGVEWANNVFKELEEEKEE